MKVMAIHLPAFHRIPENDKWWGEGFTEWDNVRSGRPYYSGHVQPVVPLSGYYYDLSKVADIRTQAIQARSHGISGFIMYHYWFGNGRKIFEKPAELLRKNEDIDIEYSFCWANDSWITTWHGRDPEELLRQEYPGKKDWDAHIEYLLYFFKDNRYSKINNRPVLYFYKPNEIPDYDAMLAYWDERLKGEGFDGLYAVEYISSKNKQLHSLSSSAVVEFEPLYTTYFDLSKFELAKRALDKFTHRIDFQDYDKLWSKILNRTRTYEGKPIIRGCFSGWDNSPRKEYNSMIVRGATPEKFCRYLFELLRSNREDVSDDYLVINAWNEWSEGAYLEPDEANGYRYLEAVSAALHDYDARGMNE